MYDEIKVNSPAIMVDQNGVILDSNLAFGDTFGYSRQEIKGQHIHKLIPQDLHAKHKDGFDKFRSGLRSSVNCFRVEGLTKAGDRLFLTISVSKHKNLMLAVMSDSTKKEKKERALLAKLG